VTADKRFSNGVQFLAAYTFSKAMDMGGGGNSGTAESRNNVQNPRDVSAEYGLADFNYPQRFSLSGIYELPVGHGKRFLGSAPRALDLLAGGWSVNSIVSAQDGPPGTLTMATTTSNTGTTQYPNRICNGNLPNDQRTIHRWYDTSCFTTPDNNTFGNAGRNVIIAPGLVDWDFAAHKDFRITEKFGLTYRAEFFNVLNKAHFNYPSTSIGSTAAGTITSVNSLSPGRQIQFALRLHF
jgi:hypothetical protein